MSDMDFDAFVRHCHRNGVSHGYDIGITVECPICGESVNVGMLGHIQALHDIDIDDQCTCGAPFTWDARSNYAHYASFASPTAHLREMAVLVALKEGC